jgi:hypothetical protein
MRVSKALDEVHAIMAQIYEDEKGLNVDERMRRRREEANKFVRERKLDIKWVSPTDKQSEAA